MGKTKYSYGQLAPYQKNIDLSKPEDPRTKRYLNALRKQQERRGVKAGPFSGHKKVKSNLSVTASTFSESTKKP